MVKKQKSKYISISLWRTNKLEAEKMAIKDWCEKQRNRGKSINWTQYCYQAIIEKAKKDKIF